MNNVPFIASKSLNLALPLIVYVIFTFAFVWISVNLFPPIYSIEAYEKNFHSPLNEEFSAANFFKTWDAQLYLYISSEGYRADIPAAGYFPLLPFLIRIFSYLTGGNHLLAGLILVNLFFVAG